ncbi:MAG: AMP-binding protein [Cyanobacteria bacterium P01_H01_bin.35]
MPHLNDVFINNKVFKTLPVEKLTGIDKNGDNNIAKVASLVDLLHYRNQHQGSDKAFTFLPKGETEEVTLTYQELDKKARAIAAMLQSIKAKGERALLLYQPGLEFIEAFFGCLYAGVIAVPVYPPRGQGKRI